MSLVPNITAVARFVIKSGNTNLFGVSQICLESLFHIIKSLFLSSSKLEINGPIGG